MTVYLIIATYLILTLLSGLIGMRQAKSESPDEYFLANRGMGSIVLFFTFIATNFSAFFFLGFAGMSYKVGYSYYAMMGLGTAFAALSFLLIGYPIWQLGKQNGYITPAELIGDQVGSKGVKLLFLLVMTLFTLPYMAIQPIGAGILLETMTNGQIPAFYGSAGLMVFIVVYVFMGGMRSVALTDLIQGLLMFVLMFWAVDVVADALGGLKTANVQVSQLRPELFEITGNGYFTWQRWFSFMILWALCVPMFPQMFMRFYISKDTKAFRISTVLYAFVPLFLFICPVIIGVLGHLSFPDLEGKAVDNVLPLMLDMHAPVWLSATIMTGALAAFMSTLDSQLLALSTMLTRDFYVPYIKPEASFSHQVKIGRVFIVLLAILALIISNLSIPTIFEIAKNAFTGLAVLFPVTVAAIYYPKRVHQIGIIAGILVGEAIVFGCFYGWIKPAWILGFDAVVPATVACTLILLLSATRKG